MNQNVGDRIEERLDRLERENRRLRWFGMAVLVAAVGGLAVQGRLQNNRHEVSAQRFVLRDETGKVRGVLGMKPDGAPHLALLDTHGESLLDMGTKADDSASLDFVRDGRSQATLFSDPTGAAGLYLMDQSEGIMSGLYMTSERTLGLDLRTEARGVNLGLERDGSARLAFQDGDGARREVLGIGADGSPEIYGFQKDNRVIYPGKKSDDDSLKRLSPIVINRGGDFSQTLHSASRKVSAP